tara:strand:+ start:5844 stop:6119 length:276 start_codon:yes stop_codon:yes gene_type:complete
MSSSTSSSTISELSLEQCAQVSGSGFISTTGIVLAATGTAIWGTLEVMHLMLGFREFVNLTVDRSIHGCNNIEEGDYFTQWACGYISPQTA